MSTRVIATDEAGYGPKLGPLVIVATDWDVPGDKPEYDSLEERFTSLRTPFQCGDQTVVIDDSKAVYKSGGGLGLLHAAVSTAVRWSGSRNQNLRAWLAEAAEVDFDSIAAAPWLDRLRDCPFSDPDLTGPLLAHWQETGIRLTGIRCRVITASRFNAHCAAGSNKADLLSESTIGLVRSLLQNPAKQNSTTTVFCDRHGGRRYYGAVLQNAFPDLPMQVVAETKQQSRYRLIGEGETIEVAFTVKGDSFAPVALSSMVAKYLRERLMESFNEFFVRKHRGHSALKPTAGYPVDADRFLADIRAIVEAEDIKNEDLIRSR